MPRAGMGRAVGAFGDFPTYTWAACLAGAAQSRGSHGFSSPRAGKSSLRAGCGGKGLCGDFWAAVGYVAALQLALGCGHVIC